MRASSATLGKYLSAMIRYVDVFVGFVPRAVSLQVSGMVGRRIWLASARAISP